MNLSLPLCLLVCLCPSISLSLPPSLSLSCALLHRLLIACRKLDQHPVLWGLLSLVSRGEWLLFLPFASLLLSQPFYCRQWRNESVRWTNPSPTIHAHFLLAEKQGVPVTWPPDSAPQLRDGGAVFGTGKCVMWESVHWMCCQCFACPVDSAAGCPFLSSTLESCSQKYGQKRWSHCLAVFGKVSEWVCFEWVCGWNLFDPGYLWLVQKRFSEASGDSPESG